MSDTLAGGFDVLREIRDKAMKEALQLEAEAAALQKDAHAKRVRALRLREVAECEAFHEPPPAQKGPRADGIT